MVRNILKHTVIPINKYFLLTYYKTIIISEKENKGYNGLYTMDLYDENIRPLQFNYLSYELFLEK